MTLIQLFTAIANAIRGKTGSQSSIAAENFPTEISNITTGKLTNAEYNEADEDLDDILENTTVPSGTLSITTNGTHDVTNYISANVNVIGENNAKIRTNFNGTDTITKIITQIPAIDVSSSSDLSNAFEKCSSLQTISIINMNGNLALTYAFNLCSSLISVSISGTGKPYGMAGMFYGCSSLTDIPVLDTSNLSNMNVAFTNCSSLSEESLNKILLMCANTTSRYGNEKTLARIGLTDAQTTICTGLSNWAAAQANGWTTGY